MPKFLNIQESKAVITVTMNEPGTRNALTGNSASEEFVNVCSYIHSQKSIKAVIVTGAGPTFSAGGNLKDMKKMLDDDIPSEVIRESYRQGIQRIPLALYNLEVPTIAAVNGAAIGAGCDLACMCDIRIASDKAIFAESFVKVGIIPGDGGAWFLPRAVGMSKAAEMSFTGDAIDAQEALRIGLISQLTTADALLETANTLANRITSNPSLVLRMTKRLLREGQKQSLESLLELSAGLQSIAHKTDDHREAVHAFLEKRKPNFH